MMGYGERSRDVLDLAFGPIMGRMGWCGPLRGRLH